MSDYFSDLRAQLVSAADQRARLPWYARLRLPARHRGLAVVIAALVVAAPAVAAVGAASGWFTVGKPIPAGRQSPNVATGTTLERSARLLPISITDPHGGPPWGIRLVKTSRGDTCLQVGRLQDGQLGEIGIDGAFNNDHEFHSISPYDSGADVCGSTDGAGYGYVDTASFGHGRIVLMGLLGPDATSIQFRRPDGRISTERTVGGVGAYLLVFPLNKATCALYAASFGASHSCNGTNYSSGTVHNPGAITQITYRGDKVCSLTPPASILTAYKTFSNRVDKLPRLRPLKANQARYSRLYQTFLRNYHLTTDKLWAALEPRCGLVGWVARKQTPVSAGQIKTPVDLHVVLAKRYCTKNWQRPAIPCDRQIPAGYHLLELTTALHPKPEVMIDFSFTAKQPVTNDHTRYAWEIDRPTDHDCGGGTLGGTNRNIRAGQRLKYQDFEPVCPGVYHLTITYTRNASPDQLPQAGGATVIAKASFKVPKQS